MLLHKKITIFSFLLCTFFTGMAQIEVSHISMKDYKATGFSAFLNFAIPVSPVSYLTIEAGLQNYNGADDGVIIEPLLLGFRYTINKSGTGFYIEPKAGYCFGATGIVKMDAQGNPLNLPNGNYVYEEVKGMMGGVGAGYIFQPSGKIQFNLGVNYEHGFGEETMNVLSFRISHTFTIGRRSE